MTDSSVEAVARAIAPGIFYGFDGCTREQAEWTWAGHSEKDRAIIREIATAAIAAYLAALPSPERENEQRLWLWRNFVDGKPEYWAFDNPFPTIDGGDPMTLGQPCGWAIFKRSTRGRSDISDSEVEESIQRHASPEREPMREALEAIRDAGIPLPNWAKHKIDAALAPPTAQSGDRT